MQNIWHHKRYAAPKLASLTLLLGLFAASSAQSVEPVFITDGLVSANIANNGAFFSGTTLGLDYNGTEFVNQGTFASWAWLKAGGMDFNQSESSGANDLALTAFSVDVASATTTFEGTPFNVVQTFTAIGSTNTLGVTVSITNTSGAALTDVYWGVGIDPDQDIGSGGSYATTYNSITGLNGGAAVKAAGSSSSSGYAVTLMNNTTSGALDIKGFVNVGNCCGDVDPLVAYTNGQSLGFANYGDDSISLAYKIGTLGVGQTATLGYNYVFAPIPEAETYGMMLAGLGLVGFCVSRRKRNFS